MSGALLLSAAERLGLKRLQAARSLPMHLCCATHSAWPAQLTSFSSGQLLVAQPVRWASSSALSSSAAGPARTSSGTSAPTQQGPIGIEPVRGALKTPVAKKADDKCGDPLQDDDEEDMVPMIDPKTSEWGGPTKGGVMPEPTRFGDWERKGRCTDFV